MLLQFKVKNYKSIRNELVFSMMKASGQIGLDYSVIERIINKTNHKVLNTGIVYGPNASGKTNIISAVDTLKMIVARGNISNFNNRSANVPLFNLGLIPNSDLNVPEDVEFFIQFISDNKLFEYGLSLNLGSFMEQEKQYISMEYLKINDQLLFERINKNVQLFPSTILEQQLREAEIMLDTAEKISNKNLNDTDLFLTNGFKSIISSDFCQQVTNWFSQKLITVLQSDLSDLIQKYVEDDDLKHGDPVLEKYLNSSAETLGIHNHSLVYVKEARTNKYILCSKVRKDLPPVPVKMYESSGTKRILNLFPIILSALESGSTLIVDELDASLHPTAVMSLINLFHNDNINKNNAQLIFNTHNPVYLDSNLFRRDEIHIVEKDENEWTVHKTLEDLKISTKHSIQNGDTYCTNYMNAKYGGITDIDFSDLAEDFLKQKQVS